MTKAKCNQTDILNHCCSSPSFFVEKIKNEICREKTAFWLRLNRFHFCCAHGRRTERFQSRSLKSLVGIEAVSRNCLTDKGKINKKYDQDYWLKSLRKCYKIWKNCSYIFRFGTYINVGPNFNCLTFQVSIWNTPWNLETFKLLVSWK